LAIAVIGAWPVDYHAQRDELGDEAQGARKVPGARRSRITDIDARAAAVASADEAFPEIALDFSADAIRQRHLDRRRRPAVA
jgi:hypothetical protein